MSANKSQYNFDDGEVNFVVEFEKYLQKLLHPME